MIRRRRSAGKFHRAGTVGRLLAFLPLFLINGCSPASVLNALVRGDGYDVATELPYGSGTRHTLDLYRPTGAKDPAPVVVFFYGGSWQTGSKESYAFVGQALASKGYIVVIPDYRVYPEVAFPGFVQDGAAAMRWTVDNVARYGGDPHRVFLMGHSAGAHIAALLTLDAHWLAEVGLDAHTAIRGTVGLAGPYDFLPITDPTLQAIFGPEKQWPASQPINFVDGKEAPMLLLAGDDDKVVDPANTTRLADRIREKGGKVTVKIYPRIGHLTLMGAVAGPLHFLAPVLDDSVAFYEGAVSP
jgi:acetyl esterase/lipase